MSNLYSEKCHFAGKSIGDQPASFASFFHSLVFSTRSRGTEIAEAKQVRKSNQCGILYQVKKRVQKTIFTFEPKKISLISFSRGSGLPFRPLAFNAGRRTDFRDKKSSDFSREIFRTGLNLSHGAKFQRFFSGKSVFLNSKFQIREFYAH